MAECSLSAGRMCTPCFCASGSTNGPPAMSVSLLARQMSLPLSMAATVGFRPAQPTMPVTHASASACAATAQMPSSPARISGCRGASLISSLSCATLEPSRTDTSAGWNLRIWHEGGPGGGVCSGTPSVRNAGTAPCATPAWPRMPLQGPQVPSSPRSAVWVWLRVGAAHARARAAGPPGSGAGAHRPALPTAPGCRPPPARSPQTCRGAPPRYPASGCRWSRWSPAERTSAPGDGRGGAGARGLSA